MSPPSSRRPPARASGTSRPASTRSCSKTPSRFSPARRGQVGTGSSSSSSTAPATTPCRSPCPRASVSSTCRPIHPSYSPPRPFGSTWTNPSSTGTSIRSPTSTPRSPKDASPSPTTATSSKAKPVSTGGQTEPSRSNHPETVSQLSSPLQPCRIHGRRGPVVELGCSRHAGPAEKDPGGGEGPAAHCAASLSFPTSVARPYCTTLMVGGCQEPSRIASLPQ